MKGVEWNFGLQRKKVNGEEVKIAPFGSIRGSGIDFSKLKQKEKQIEMYVYRGDF